jgi:hypothetical protein
MKLAIWGTAAFGHDIVVSDDNRPAAFRNSEIAERFMIFFASDEGRRAVLSDWAGETVSSNDQVSTLV